MKKLLVLGMALIAGALATPPTQALSTANVRWVFNQVQITRGGRWIGAINNTYVLSGAYVRTGYNSRAQLNYADGTVMRLGSATIVRVREAVAKNVQVNRGTAYFKVSPQQQQMRVRTRTAVATVLGTEFVVEVKPPAAKRRSARSRSATALRPISSPSAPMTRSPRSRPSMVSSASPIPTAAIWSSSQKG